MSKSLKSVDLHHAPSGVLVSDPAHAVKKEAFAKNHVIRPQTNVNGQAADGQTVDFIIQPGSLKDNIKSVNFECAFTAVGGTSFVPNNELMIQSYTLSVGGSNVTPIFNGSGEELLFMNTSMLDHNELRKSIVPLNYQSVYNYLPNTVNVGNSMYFSFHLHTLSYLLSQVPMQCQKFPITISIKFQPVALLGTSTGSVWTFVATDSTLLRLSFNSDPHARKQISDALLNKDLSICYTSTKIDQYDITNSTDTIFDVTVKSDPGETFMMTFSLLNTSTAVLYRDPQRHWIAASRITDRVDLKGPDSSTSVIGGACNPIILATDDRLPNTLSTLTEPKIGAANTNSHRYLPFIFASNLTESFLGHINGAVSQGPWTIQFLGTVDCVASANLARTILWQHKEVHFSARTGEFKVVM